MHAALRDATADVLRGRLAPQAPPGDYPALYPLAHTPRVLAAQLEDDCAAAWRFLYAQAAAVRPTSRCASGQAELTASAVRATKWRLLSPAVRGHAGVAWTLERRAVVWRDIGQEGAIEPGEQPRVVAADAVRPRRAVRLGRRRC